LKQNPLMSSDFKQTVRIVRNGSDEPTELELVSTVMLERILKSDDSHRKDELREAAKGCDGVLAHNADSDRFEIIDDYELPQDIVLEPVAGSNDDGKNDFSLVSTQMLQRMLSKDDDQKGQVATEPERKVVLDQGFDPYNSN